MQEKVLPEPTTVEEQLYSASQWKLMWWRFRKHKLALVGGIVIGLMYFVALFVELLAPNDPHETDSQYAYAPPQAVHMVDQRGRFFGELFFYALEQTRDPVTLRLKYTADPERRIAIRLFSRGPAYRLWGIIESDLHLLAATEGAWFPLGSDRMGRCILSRIIYGARISTSIGLLGVLLSFFLGLILGGFSGYLGGAVDNIVQRTIEFFNSIPKIPLWMALSAALPAHWAPIKVYFGITIILSFFGWTGLARVVRGKILSLRGEDFVVASELTGASHFKIIRVHLIPSFLSHIIASITLAIPAMIIGETSLSFLGIGLRPPVISWGVLLQEAQNLETIAVAPWLLTPVLFVIATVLAFNFLGDGLRDAADPYSV
jgi:peptide/nickel transport system permease protein